MINYIIIFVLLVLAELIYFRIADKFNIIDKPNERSSHTKVVLRGGGVIFVIALWIWSFFFGFQYPWLLAGVTLAAGISFIDDIRSLPDSVRLVCQFLAMCPVLYEIGITHMEYWWIAIPVSLFVFVGATNIYNFMDGINGINGAYTLAVLVPLAIKNDTLIEETGAGFVEPSLLNVAMLSMLVFCYFNFRPKGKAKCFAGDVGSVASAFIVVFALGSLLFVTNDLTYGVFLCVYGVDAILTIVHRIQLHENLGEAHRKHAFQIMANELGMEHTTVSTFYAGLQLIISLGMLAIPDTAVWHWIYIVTVCFALMGAYVIFMKKYYPLHEAYLKSLK